LFSFSSYSYLFLRDLHSFPTRRSSDLSIWLTIIVLCNKYFCSYLIAKCANHFHKTSSCLIDFWKSSSNSNVLFFSSSLACFFKISPHMLISICYFSGSFFSFFFFFYVFFYFFLCFCFY